MAPIDIVVLAVIGIAFVAVCVRIYRKGTCADCAQGGVCTGHCSNKKTCAALKGVDKIAEDPGAIFLDTIDADLACNAIMLFK